MLAILKDSFDKHIKVCFTKCWLEFYKHDPSLTNKAPIPSFLFSNVRTSDITPRSSPLCGRFLVWNLHCFVLPKEHVHRLISPVARQFVNSGACVVHGTMLSSSWNAQFLLYFIISLSSHLKRLNFQVVFRALLCYCVSRMFFGSTML